MANQTQSGKAFEYACAFHLHDFLKNIVDAHLIQNKSYINAKGYYLNFGIKKQKQYDDGAKAIISTLINLEPNLVNIISNEIIEISLQEDSKGQKGDVRDILFIKRNMWEIGLSIKHNHSAVKHSRLSQTIDFGEKWVKFNSSDEYFKNIKPIFSKLKSYKQKNILWRDLVNKESEFYIPLLSIFSKELLNLYNLHGSQVPRNLVEYLIGSNDFYKIISHNKLKMTEIIAYPIHSKLNLSAGKLAPKNKILSLKLPSKIFDISFKENSKNTVLLTMDEGWQISFRIHNASSKVEPSLKFDIKLISQPKTFSHFSPWQ